MKRLMAVALLCVASTAQAHLSFYEGTFSPEAPGATGSGTLRLEYDDDGHTLLINATWAGLSGNTNNAHIHCCTAGRFTGTAGVALAQGGLLPGFPLGAKNGSYSRLIDLTQTNQYGGAFLTSSGGTAALAEARLMSNLASGNAYFNIHSTTFGGGEIRAFVTAVPEPQTAAMLMLGLTALGWSLRQRRA